jgi:threonine synthase
MQGLRDSVHAGTLHETPTLHAVQTEGAWPLVRAWRKVQDRLASSPELAHEGVIAEVARNRSAYMSPWESEPRSIAGGILDDETYDWLPVVADLLDTGGSAVTVSEHLLVEANERARAVTGVDVDPTGSAGLAGLMALQRAGVIAPGDEVLLLFTGASRTRPI